MPSEDEAKFIDHHFENEKAELLIGATNLCGPDKVLTPQCMAAAMVETTHESLLHRFFSWVDDSVPATSIVSAALAIVFGAIAYADPSHPGCQDTVKIFTGAVDGSAGTAATRHLSRS